ncbi:hypothetical protein DSECCO2_371150 [anaerobic digester metagenome]
MLQHDLPRIGDHRPVVAEIGPLRDGKRRPPVLAHRPEHLLQPRVRPDPADEQHLVLTGMRERPLGHLDAHGKRGLLQARADILEWGRALLGGADETGEGEIHPLHRIREFDVVSLPRKPLDGRTARVREVVAPGELVERVPKPDIQCLAEYPVTAVQEAEHLRVRAARIQDDRVGKPGRPSPDLDVSNTVVDADERHTKRDREGPRGGRHRPEGRAETGSLGEGDRPDTLRLREHPGDDLLHHRCVVLRGLPRMDPAFLRDIGGGVEGDQPFSKEGGTEVPRRPLKSQHQPVFGSRIRHKTGIAPSKKMAAAGISRRDRIGMESEELLPELGVAAPAAGHPILVLRHQDAGAAPGTVALLQNDLISLEFVALVSLDRHALHASLSAFGSPRLSRYPRSVDFFLSSSS